MSDLHKRLLSFMADESSDRFEHLALDIFAYQFARNGPYRAFCEARGVDPGSVHDWSEIPAVPADAFKAVPLVCGDPDTVQATFRTSGTTRGAGNRGSHFVLDLEPYRTALRLGFESHLLSDGSRPPILGLVPPASEVPDSSLSFMVADVMETFGAAGSGWFVSLDGGLDAQRLLETLGRAEKESTPLLLAGTSFTFVHLFDAMREHDVSFQLPQGSRVMDTGGFKGHSREVRRFDLLTDYQDRLSVTPEYVVNEYGMTEMTSQFYDGVAGEAHTEPGARRYHGPHWVRTRAADPETLALAGDGEPGVLRHWDLGNIDSVMVLQTADMGVVRSSGFELFGRAAGAEARGCSIAMDELLQTIGR